MSAETEPACCSDDASAAAMSPEPQFTMRGVLTGMVCGAVLSLCNLSTGLKAGWLMGVSITAAIAGILLVVLERPCRSASGPGCPAPPASDWSS